MAWAWASPSAAWRAHDTVSRTENAPYLRTHRCRSAPSMYSITKKHLSWAVLASWVVTMFGWSSLAAARISWWNRAAASGVAARCGQSTLMATGRCIIRCIARYT